MLHENARTEMAIILSLCPDRMSISILAPTAPGAAEGVLAHSCPAPDLTLFLDKDMRGWSGGVMEVRTPSDRWSIEEVGKLGGWPGGMWRGVEGDGWGGWQSSSVWKGKGWRHQAMR